MCYFCTKTTSATKRFVLLSLFERSTLSLRIYFLLQSYVIKIRDTLVSKIFCAMCGEPSIPVKFPSVTWEWLLETDHKKSVSKAKWNDLQRLNKGWRFLWKYFQSSVEHVTEKLEELPGLLCHITMFHNGVNFKLLVVKTVISRLLLPHKDTICTSLREVQGVQRPRFKY